MATGAIAYAFPEARWLAERIDPIRSHRVLQYRQEEVYRIMSGDIKNNQSKDYQAIHRRLIREKAKSAASGLALTKGKRKEEKK